MSDEPRLSLWDYCGLIIMLFGIMIPVIAFLDLLRQMVARSDVISACLVGFLAPNALLLWVRYVKTQSKRELYRAYARFRRKDHSSAIQFLHCPKLRWMEVIGFGAAGVLPVFSTNGGEMILALLVSAVFLYSHAVDRGTDEWWLDEQFTAPDENKEEF